LSRIEYGKSPATRWDPTLYRCAGVALLGVVLLGMIRPLLAIGRYIPLDPNEGWNAYFADAASNGGVLYPPADALITNNYPPLSFYIVGAIGHLTGDSIFAGRLVALLSLLFVAWSIYRWLTIVAGPREAAADTAARPPASGAAVASQTRAVYPAVVAALTFLAYAVTYGRVYVAMDDPQWLAHALMLGGLLVLWRHPQDTRNIVLGALLMMAAGWTKHLLIPLPVTVSLWLLWRSRPAFATWLVSATSILAIGALIAWWFYGVRMFESLNEPREFMRWKAITEAANALRCFAPLVALWLAALFKERMGERMAFASLYLIISTGVAVFAAGGAGVDVNAFFDTLIALCLIVGLALERLSAGPRSLGAPAAVALAICLIIYGVSVAPVQLRDIRNIDADEQTALQDIQVLEENGHGHAACEMLSLCYWAGSAFTVDFFYFGQKLKTGALPHTACADTFEHGHITMVQLESNPRWRAKLLPNDCDALITTQYQPIRESNFGPLLTHAAHP
jgi:hypothetical protein